VPDESDARRPAAHDPTGLDVARAVAAALRGTSRRGAGDSGRRTRRWRRATDASVSGAYPDDRDPQPLQAALGRLVSEQGWATDVAVHGVFSRWGDIVGPVVAQHCTPQSYADGVLTVQADSTAWATQVRLLAPALVRRLNEELGDGTVLRVQVLAPTAPSWRKGLRSIRGARGPRDTYG
jgi:predicted nucleic acid-binding Zn ribbon protein